MEIKVSDLKKFRTLSGHVNPTKLVPIHLYIKLGGGFIQYQDAESFVKYKCSDAKESVLIEEKSLFDFIGETNNLAISFTHKNNKTILSAGKRKIEVQVPELKLFNDIKDLSVNSTPLSRGFSEAIGAASKCCQKMGTVPDKYMYVMVGNKGATGISQSYGYYRPIEEDVTMVLEKKVADYLSKVGITAFSETDGHYIFYTNEAVLGFTKQMIGYGDFAKMLRGDLGKLTFTCSNSEIKSFNSLSISLCEFPIVTMTKKGTLEMYDSLKDVLEEEPLNGLTPSEDFNYNPRTMNDILSALYTEELDFYQHENFVFIKERDTSAVALVGKIAKP